MSRWGSKDPISPEAWDPAHAGDPSVHVPRVRRPPPAEAAAPEEQRAEEPRVIDRPGDEPGDFWLEPWDAQDEERIDAARREEEQDANQLEETLYIQGSGLTNKAVPAMCGT